MTAKVGDRVRVTIEGWFDAEHEDLIRIVTPMATHVVVGADEHLTITKLEEA